LDDVPEEIKKKIKFIFVETVGEVLEAALEKGRIKKRSKTKKKITHQEKQKEHA